MSAAWPVAPAVADRDSAIFWPGGGWLKSLMGDRCASVLALSPQVENWVQSQTTWRDKSQERCDLTAKRGHFEFRAPRLKTTALSAFVL